VRIQMKKNDFDKQQSALMKKDLMKHKENIENIFKRKLEEEKRKLLKQRVDEVDQLMKENKRLNAKIASKSPKPQNPRLIISSLMILKFKFTRILLLFKSHKRISLASKL